MLLLNNKMISTSVKVLLVIVVVSIILFLVAKYYIKFETFDDLTNKVIADVQNYTSAQDQVFGEPIPTVQQKASLVGVPSSLDLIQASNFSPSTNLECENLNENGNFMSRCPMSKPSFTVATSLLPKDAPSSEWAVPDCVRDSLENQNFLSAAQRVGNSTTNGVLRNASLDIRSEVPNPMVPVSVWNASTITPDLYKRPIE